MKKRYKIIIGIVVVLIAFRLYLPTLVTNYVNKTLQNIPEYTGSVRDVDISLYRGAYKIHELNLEKIENETEIPFVKIKKIDLSVEWRALLEGSLVGEIILHQPELNFIGSKKADNDSTDQTGEDVDWTKPIKELFPLQINLFQVNDGTIHYRDFTSSPEIDLFIEHFNGKAMNLTNASDSSVALPSSLEVSATVLNSGTLEINGHLNLLKQIPDMELNGQIEHVELTELNDFAQAYAALDFEAGTMDVFSEIVIKDAQLSGYVKPLLHEIKIFNLKEDKKNPLKLAWEAVAGFVVEIFENQKEDQFATKVPLQGDLSSPDTPIWPIIGKVLSNAFIEAFKPQIDNEIEFGEK